MSKPQTRDFILSELKRIGRKYKVEKDNASITCPYHRPGQNSFYNSSLSINLKEHYYRDKIVPVGFFRCWSCKIAGVWNRLVSDKKLDVKPISDQITPEDPLLDFDILEDEDKIYTRPPSFFLSEWEGSWRGIPEDLLKNIGCLKWFDYDGVKESSYGGKYDRGGEDRLWIPVSMWNREIGYIGALLRKRTKKEIRFKKPVKYRNSNGEWASEALFPFDLLEDDQPIVLVEGPYDALRLINEGIPALSILGTQNWTETKRTALLQKASKVILCMDGDRSGRECARYIEDDIEDYIDIKKYNIPLKRKKSLDPGNMPMRYIEELGEMI